jgi:hypothetical protein
MQRLLSSGGRCQLHSHRRELAVGSPISAPATMTAIVGGAGTHAVLLLPVRRDYRCVGTAAWPLHAALADEGGEDLGCPTSQNTYAHLKALRSNRNFGDGRLSLAHAGLSCRTASCT